MDEELNRVWRRDMGAAAYDALLERQVGCFYLLVSQNNLHCAYGRMGGHEPADAPCIVGHGETYREAAMAMLESPAAKRPNLKSSLWALGQAMGLAAEAMSDNRQHEWFKCEQPCERPGSCMYCDGGLAFCVKCKQAECELEDYCRGS